MHPDSVHDKQIQTLLQTLNDLTSNPEKIQREGNQFYQAISNGDFQEAGIALRILAPHIATISDPMPASYLALLCGALLEQGHDPELLLEPLFARFAVVLADLKEFFDRCVAITPQILTEDGVNQELWQKTQEKLAPSFPMLAGASQGMDMLWRPVMTVCSMRSSARAMAQKFRPTLEALQDADEGCMWLSRLLATLDNEPIVVLEPSTGLGFSAKMSGVADNFQLHTLLMDIFPNPTQTARATPESLEVAWGTGPQSGEESVVGHWNMYDWRALSGSKTLGDSSSSNSDLWIWGEGIPSDIPTLHGFRVVLLGEAAYQRSWNSMRTFGHLKPEFSDLHQLSPLEVEEWMEKLIQTPHV